MKRLKNFYKLAFILVFSLFLFGCANLISTETSTVKVEVVSVDFKDSYITYYYNPATKTCLPQNNPEKYEVIVEYNDVTYKFTGKDTYEKCSDKVGKKVNATLEIDKYDDGTVKYIITDIE